jgi:hypothetical protein
LYEFIYLAKILSWDWRRRVSGTPSPLRHEVKDWRETAILAFGNNETA